MIDVISLAQKLIGFDTRQPAGNERPIAEYIGDFLSKNNFDVSYSKLTDSRWSVVAERSLAGSKPPIILTGHLDTVPLGKKEWLIDPFVGVNKDGKLYGRGSSDMKCGVAAMIVAALKVMEESQSKKNIKLIFTASEEVGLEGANYLVNSNFPLGEASAIIVGEPTANVPAIGHKGGLFLYARTLGVTAHSSMPEKGESAIYKAAQAISKIEKYCFDIDDDPLLGMPSINVGMMSGGLNPNSVPDWAEFTIDVRSTRSRNHFDIIKDLELILGNDVSLETFVDQSAVVTPETNPFIQLVYKIAGFNSDEMNIPNIVPYLTDASAFQEHYKDVPIIILGPGQPELAHQTDEFCYVDAMIQAVNLYHDIILGWPDN
jgi:succinyl-diaminopimelate desuccinylase